MVGIFARADDVRELLDGQSGRLAVLPRCNVAGDERSELLAAVQVARHVNLLRRAKKRVRVLRVRRRRVAVVAAANRVHQITAQPDALTIASLEIEGNPLIVREGQTDLDP